MKHFLSKELRIPLTTAALILLLTQCAPVQIYSDAGLKEQTGLRFYTLKPYLLVEYHAARDNTVKTTVVFLPDMGNPQYLKMKAGLGANKLSMTFGNSALTSYGLASESQLPELLESFASMLSKSAYAAQAFTGPPPAAPDEAEVSFRLYEIITGPGGTSLKEVILER